MRLAGVTVRNCEVPGSGGLQPDQVLSQDAVISDDDNDMGGLASGFSTSLAKGYTRGDPRGSKMGTSLSPPPPPPHAVPAPVPRGFAKPSAADSKVCISLALNPTSHLFSPAIALFLINFKSAQGINILAMCKSA